MRWRPWWQTLTPAERAGFIGWLAFTLWAVADTIETATRGIR